MSPSFGAATGTVRSILRLEAAAVAIVAVVLYGQLGGAWLWFALLFFAPDLSMLAFTAGPRWGARAYNAVHSGLAPFALWALGTLLAAPVCTLLALILVAHIGLDRALGYCLKYPAAFTHTHLGPIGKARG